MMRSPTTSAAHACRLLGALCAVLLLLFFPLRGYAQELQSTATATPSPSPVIGMKGTVLDEFSEGVHDGWIGGTGISALTLAEEEGVLCLKADTQSGSQSGVYTLMRLFGEDRRNLMDHTHLSLGVKIGENNRALYTVSVILYSGMSSVTAQTEISGGTWHILSADISAWYLRTSVDFLEIRIHGEADVSTQTILLSGVTATGQASLDAVQAFLTFGFHADGGEAIYEDGVYRLDAGEDGILTLLADAARYEYVPGEGVAALKIVLTNTKQDGTLSLAVSDEFTGVSSFSISSSCRLYAGTNTYLLPFDAGVALRAYRLSFRGLYPTDGSVCLTSVSLVYLPEPDTSAYAGKITSCAFGEGLTSLTVTGTLPSKTVADNISGTIALYEIPVWSTLEEVLANGAPIAQIKISTRFSFNVNLKGRETSAAVSRYTAVLLSEESVRPIAAARFPDAADGEVRSHRSAVGLSGASAAGAFAANAANVIVDVYVDELLGGAAGSSNGRLCIRGGRYYYLDTQYLRTLDNEIRFYSAADVDVYFRLLCGEDLSERGFSLSYEGAGFFAFDVTNEEGAYMLSAVTDYLAAAYPSLRGFIVGERMDSAVYSGADMSDLPAYAALCADTLQVVYTAAAAHIPDVSVIAPVGHYLAESKSDADADTVLLSVYLSKYIAERSNMPLALLYVSDSAEEMGGHLENLLGRMNAMHVAAPSELFLLWQPSPTSTEELVAEYSSLCDSLFRLGARAFFLGVERQTDTDALYRALKQTQIRGDTGRSLHEFPAALLQSEPGENDYTGTYTLYDFSKSFSTLSWIAGSGCESLSTQADMFADNARTLHADFFSDDNSLFGKTDGSILCMMPADVDFTAAPYLSVSMRIVSALEGTDTAEVIFVLGSADARAEYAITVPTGQPTTVLLDLSVYGGASAITSAAIAVRADSPVTMDVSQIRAHSRTHTSDALSEHFAAAFSDAVGSADTTDSFTVAQGAMIIFLLIVTLSAFALLSRKENEKRHTHCG